MGEDGSSAASPTGDEDGLDVDAFERASRELDAARPARGCPDEVVGDAAARSGSATRSPPGTFTARRGGGGRPPRRHLRSPSRGGDERIGVIELFSHEVRERDPEIYALTEALGTQIGEFIEGLGPRRPCA